MRSLRRRLNVIAVLLLAAAAGPAAAAQQPASQQPPSFRAAVDVIPVDVVVLDGRGAQVTDLQAADFRVAIDGRPRRIISAKYVGYAATAEAARRAPASPRISSNQEPPGRLVMLVVDEAGMDFGGTRAAIEGVKRLLATLGPRDAVGLSLLPYTPVAVPFTRDQAAVVAALTRSGGRSVRRLSLSTEQVGWAEAVDFARNPASLVQNGVVGRECAYCQSDKRCAAQCVLAVETEAQSMVAEIRQRTAEFGSGMRRLLAYLRAIDAPKTVVLLSSGLAVDPGEDEIRGVGREAAGARCSIYALRFNPWDAPSAEESRPSPSGAADVALRRTSLESLAAYTRGWVFDLVGDPSAPFQKLGNELAGFYLLGVEAEPGDSDGKTHRINVEVGRKNLTVRARRELLRAERSSNGRSPADAVQAMLISPMAVSDVPLRVTTYVGPAPEGGKLRVVIAAEIGRGSATPQQLAIGWTLATADGKVRNGGSGKWTLTPAVGRSGAPLSFVRTAVVEAGSYTLKLAVLDGEGRAGSVTHDVEARLRSAGPLAIGDLVIGPPPGGAAPEFEPPVECVIAGDRLFVYLPVFAPDLRALSSVRATVEIARGEEDHALLQSAVGVRPRGAGERAVQASVPISLLPPGSYVARVRLASGGAPVAAANRPFVYLPAARAGAAPGTAPGAAGAPFAAPRFALAEVLEPAALAPVLDRAAKADPDVPASVLSDARAGRLGEAVKALPVDAAGPVPPFLRGLALLQGGELEAAAKEFRDSRRSSPEFVDAVLFLGICYVAGGKDEEAVGALQTARFGLDGEPMLHHLLIDARLRRQQFGQALTVAEQAARRWPGDARFQLQLAHVLAASGDAPRALTLLDAYLADRRQDVQALFLALRLLYDSATAPKGKPAADLVRRFQGYAALYDAADGPARALVAEWLRYLTR